MRARGPVFAAFLSIYATSHAFAWTASTRIAMIDDAIKLMPTTLRTVLEKRRSDVLRGMLEPLTREDTPAHRPPWEDGSIQMSVESAAREIVAGTETRKPFADIAGRFGVLAHFVADAGFPPGAAGAPGAPRYAHFAAFCETKRPKFPLVFYGHDDGALSTGDFKAFTLGVLERARAEDVTLARAYARSAGGNDAAAFDDRSVPFAVASLSYSHSVTDIVRAWLAAWSECHGDFGGTPYRGAK